MGQKCEFCGESGNYPSSLAFFSLTRIIKIPHVAAFQCRLVKYEKETNSDGKTGSNCGLKMKIICPGKSIKQYRLCNAAGKINMFPITCCIM